MQEITANGLQTALVSEGSGPPVILLHGWAANHRCWKPTVEALKDDHRVVVPDLPGHGRSQGGRFPYSMDFYRRWLETLIDALELETLALVGNSLGGALSLHYALANPGKASRLVLVNPMGLSRRFPWGAGWMIVRRLHHLLGASLTRQIDPYLLRFLRGMAIVDPWGAPKDALIETTQANARRFAWGSWPGSRAILVDFLWPRRRLELARALGQIAAPTLIAWGRQDRYLPETFAREGEQAIPGAILHFFERSAHMPMIEEPDEFNREVRAFLQ
jgi:pimeloyl-ACP methyl ester carboxylesterase